MPARKPKEQKRLNQSHACLKLNLSSLEISPSFDVQLIHSTDSHSVRIIRVSVLSEQPEKQMSWTHQYKD